MISIEKALRIVKRETGKLGSERVRIEDSVNRILAENIVADMDLPPFDRSQMDGYAVRATDVAAAPVELRVVGESVAGKAWNGKLGRGEAVRIMTGAPVPAGADAVQRVELTSDKGFASGAETVTILNSLKKGTSIVKRGAEIRVGNVVVRSGELVTSNNIAALAAFGYSRVLVAKRPTVAIMSTGSEIVDIQKRPTRDQIRNSNSIMLKTLAAGVGADCEIFGSATDDLKILKAQIKAATKGRDILVLTGGVSVGKYDLTKAALAELGAEIYVEKIRLKPGKPMVFARLGKTLVFGLPGNPVSAAVTFCLFVRMAILQLQSARLTQLERGRAVLSVAAKAAKDRDTFLPATLSTSANGELIAASLRSQGSSDLIGFARAEGLIFLKAGTSANAGEAVDIYFL